MIPQSHVSFTSSEYLSPAMAAALFLLMLLATAALQPATARHKRPGHFPPAPPVVNPIPAPAKCSIDALKLGLCLDVLGGLVHVGLGDAVENICCPVLQGVLELEAAVCLCTAINLKLLNLNIYIPLALQVLVTCGKDPPPGYLCPTP